MRKLKDNYKIYVSKFIGTGTYSRVYICRYIGPPCQHIPSNTDLAIKIIHIKHLSQNTMRIINEEIKITKLLMKFPHPNIVEYYDIIKDMTKQTIYIIMEYCCSGDLRQLLKKPLKEKWCKFYFNQLAQGLKHLSEHNIMHRDLKPMNILLTNKRKLLKIADFGFAKQSKTNTKTVTLYNTVCGSPLYMAPEIMDINHGKYNNQTDLWSIGMILYELLYTKHPFSKCKGIVELALMIENEDIPIPPPDTKNTNVSDECIDLLRRLLQKTAQNRITWKEFFNHPWLPSSPKKDEELHKYKDEVCAASLSSLPSSSGTDHELNIIENFIDIYMGKSHISDEYAMIDSYESDESSSPICFDDDLIFPMDDMN